MQTDVLSQTFAALADPTRRAILARLADGECSVTELAAPFDMSLPAVSKHLRVLERAGLVTRRADAQWRHCSIDAGPIKSIVDWAAHYQHLWQGRLSRLDAYLQKVQSASKSTTTSKETDHARKRRR